MNRFKYKPNTVARKYATFDIPLKAWHHLLVKLRQLVCLHGDYVYLTLATQRDDQRGGGLRVYAVGCKKCGWINHPSEFAGMPRTLRRSYDRTYLKITNNEDALLSDKGKS